MLPFIVDWARGGARAFRRARCSAAISQMPAMREAAVAASAAVRLRALADRADHRLRRRTGRRRPTTRATRFEHIGFTVPFNMCEQPAASINCGYTASGPADRAADHRPSLRRPRRAAGGARLGGDAADAAAVAGAAGGLIQSRIRAGAWRRCRAEGKHVEGAPRLRGFQLFFVATGRIADEKVHGPLHGPRG